MGHLAIFFKRIKRAGELKHLADLHFTNQPIAKSHLTVFPNSSFTKSGPKFKLSQKITKLEFVHLR